jgi:hypothetical protein
VTAYLSIDIDYWQAKEGAQAKRFFGKLSALKVPIICVVSHEKILEHVNAHPADVLVNIDAHSDLCPLWTPMMSRDLSDGNWANYVSWRSKAEYRWCWPHHWDTYESGLCGKWRIDPFVQREDHDWRTTRAVKGTQLRDLEILAIGIAVSPEYVEAPMSEEVLRYLHLPDEWLDPMCRFGLFSTPITRHTIRGGKRIK